MEVLSKFTLPKEKVIVRYISRNTGMASNVDKNHVISGGMLEGSRRTFVAPLLRSNVVANVLTNDEKEFLEEETKLDLSVYKDFWKEQIVSLYKGDNHLDLSIPSDYISYKILLANTDSISPDWESRFKKQTYQFAITSEDDEFIEKKKGFDKKKEAFKLYGKIEDDRAKLIGIFKLLSSKPIADTTSLEWIQSKVEEFIDVKPEKFVALFNDSSLETKLLITEGVNKGVIKIKGNKYATEDGLQICENGEVPTFENAVRYLDNPKHQEIRTLIEAKINSKK